MKYSHMHSLLAVVDLTTRLFSDRGRIEAVDGVCFTIEPGQTMGLVGESGCGKSVLVRTIMGLLPKRSAVSPETKIIFQNENLRELTPEQLRQIIGKEIAMVFQDSMTSLNPVMKVGRQIEEVLTYREKMNARVARKRTVELLKMVGIPMAEQRTGHYPHQLSGGLRQRVAIAIALACEPKLLIADEPTTALDVTVQAEILGLLKKLQQEKEMAMLLISHDLSVVSGRTDKTAVMYAGKIVEYAPTPRLFSNVCMPYTRALLDAIPRMTDPPHKELHAIEGQPPDPFDPPPGCRFEPRCSRAIPKCKVEEPPLQPIGDPEHRVACWKALGINT